MSAWCPGPQRGGDCLRRPMRGLCSGRQAPKGFEGFAPKRQKSGAAAANKESASSKKGPDAKDGGQGSSSGGGGGGGGGGWNFNNLSNDRIMTIAAAGGLGALVLSSSVGGSSAPAMQEISMQHFTSHLLAAGRVRRLTVVNGNVVRISVDGAAAEGGGETWGGSRDAVDEPAPTFYVTIPSLENFEERLEAAQLELGVAARDFVPVQFVTERSWAVEAGRLVPTFLLLGFFYMLSRGAAGMGGMMGGGGAGGLFNVGKSKAVKATKVSTRFGDVAGLHEAKREVMEFVDILQNPERYTKLGAKIPKGAMLVGPPGCGKTLLAKATAGESKAPFYSISGSDFIEMFVGVGPARVRDLFAQARANAPCLIFIDEIDAVGRARGKGGFNGGNDERENTLNQLLIELDGFSPSSGIVVLAGTNRADVLDPALLRPGRFDRQIVVDKPDIKGRLEIFSVHLKNLLLDASVETYAKKMAALTPGFSGAEVANVCNEAALIAARRFDKSVGQKAFDSAIDRVIAGLEKKDLTIDPYERRVIAFHEAGHAIVGWLLEHADPVMKVSIVPRGKAALGYSQSLPRDVPLYTEGQLEDMMCMALGGRAAEEVVFNEVSSGAQNDLERVTNMAHAQVTVYGMSAAVGPLSFENSDESNTLYRPYSEKTARLIDSEVDGIISTSYARAIDLLTENKEKLHSLAEALLEKEVIGTDDLISVLGPRPFAKSVEWDEFINASWKPKEKAKAAEVEEAEVEDLPGGVQPAACTSTTPP